jgi:general secretion pathway protein G
MESAMSRLVRKRGRKAFTLLEVLMVVVIIGLLAAFVVPQLFGTEEGAKKKLAAAAITAGLGGIDRYRLDMGHYPRSEDGGLTALVEKPSDEQEAKKWNGPYVKAEGLRDPWGREYVYEFPGRYNEGSYDLSSPGPDGESGGDDDITNWKKD